MKCCMLMIVLTLWSSYAVADCIKFETTDRHNGKPITWTCKMTSVNVQSGLAKFEYRVRKGRRSFQLHITRIRSWQANKNDQVRMPLPRTQSDLASPLTGDIERPREMWVSPEFCERHSNVRIISRWEDVNVIKGTIMEYPDNNGEFKIRCELNDDKTSDIENVLPQYLNTWIRNPE